MAPSPLESVPEMRSTAKWTLAALGAVGAVLLGAVPLEAIGKLTSTGDFLLVAGGLVLSVGGISWAIWQTAEALTPPVTTIADFESAGLASLRAQLKRSPGTFYGPFGASASELVAACRFHESLAVRFAEAASSEPDLRRRHSLERASKDAQANVDLARGLQQRLLEFTHAWQVRAVLRRARLHTMMGVAVTVVGALLIMFGTGDF